MKIPSPKDFFSLLLCILVSCYLDADTVSQREDSAVILPAAQARVENETLAWQFDISYPGKYVAEVIVDLEYAKNSLEGIFMLNGQLSGDTINKSILIEDGLVAEFTEPLLVTEAGTYQLSLQFNQPIHSVRLVPEVYVRNRILNSSEKYFDKWLKLHQSPEKVAAMEWYRDARFGMFIHWGVYSEAAGEWKGQKIEEGIGPKVAEWIQFAFQISRSEYREFAKQFKPDKSFAQNIARLAKGTGMRYVVITAKHHDGFALFDSACSEWDVADATPYEGDLIKELYDACRAEGIDFGVYYSHGHDWGDGTDANYANVKAYRDQYGVPTRPNGKNLWDPSPNSFADYLENKAYPQIQELIQLMPDLRLIWFDGEGLITEAEAFRFYKMIYDLNPNIVVNRRVGYDFGDYMDAGDNTTPAADELVPKHFETCGTGNHSWGYKAHDHDWKNANQLLRNFVDIVSKGGNYLLNIGPDGKGRVPEACVDSFLEMGTWVKTNEVAIFGTKRWKVFSEGVDNSSAKPGQNPPPSKPTEFWFSAKDNNVYVMSLAAPANHRALIKSLNKSAGKITHVRQLGSEELIKWKQTSKGLKIDFKEQSLQANGYALEVTFDPATIQ